jgi:hypothetical protein
MLLRQGFFVVGGAGRADEAGRGLFRDGTVIITG